ncbi:MAG: hypothetical protein WCO56_00075 [Verrucomicrobiota bacterium]
MHKLRMNYLWKHRHWAVVLTAVLGAGLGQAAEKDVAMPKGIKVESYMGWDKAIRVTADAAEVRLVAIPAVGGNVLRYQLMGENIFWEDSRTLGLTSAQVPKDFMPGGYQLEVNDMSGSRSWTAPATVKELRDLGMTIVGDPDPVSGLQLEKEIVLDPETGDAGIVQRLKNTSFKPQTCSLRARLLCKGGGYAMLPLNKHSRLPAGWGIRRTVEGKSVYDHYKPALPTAKIADQTLFLETTSGQETWVGADCSGQWAGYVQGQTMLVVYYPFTYTNKYAGDGHTVEVGWNGAITEIAIISPQLTLKAGETLTFPMKWAALPVYATVANLKQARAQAARIAPSPFK